MSGYNRIKKYEKKLALRILVLFNFEQKISRKT